MRISDWSSDVCSSDLLTNPATLPHEYCNPTLPITPSLSTALAGAQDKLRPRAEVEGAALQISQPRHLTQMATRPCETRRNPAISALSDPLAARFQVRRSEEHTSELQSLMRISYAVFCLKKKKVNHQNTNLKPAY